MASRGAQLTLRAPQFSLNFKLQLNRVCLFVCLSICLFVCLSVCLFVCLSVCLLYVQLRRSYLGAGYGSSSSDDEVEDNDYIVPRGRLLEDYQRLALHTERHLKGEW